MEKSARRKGGSMRHSKANANARRKVASILTEDIDTEIPTRPKHTTPQAKNLTPTPTQQQEDSSESSDGIATPSPTLSGMNGHAGEQRDTPIVSNRTRMARKASSPMAPAFMVSAPGKVIVFGEHAVVHGKRAMAAAISLRSYLLVTTLSKSHRTITLNFRDIELDHTWDIDSLPWELFRHPSKKKFYYDSVTSLDTELLEAIQPHVADISIGKPDDVRKIHQSSATAFLYLFLSLSSPQTHAAVYTLRSTIPIGAGLGSSASIAVCLSAALLLQIRILAGPHQDQPPEEAETQIERINKWAFVGEMCIHGNPSGVDNTVSAGGKAVIFRRGDYSKPPSVTPILDFPELPLLLVNSRQPRSTATEVAKVGKFCKAHPAVSESILEAIDQVTESASDFIQSGDFDSSSIEAIDHFGELFRINHGLLVSLGVSHPRLERIRELVDHTGSGWTKLTGAGGGGCAITLLRANTDPAVLRQLEKTLDDEGFERYETTLGGHGIGVLWPAVLKNGTDEEGGEEIDQQKFENAVGNAGIERLVGVGGYERREGWKFWKRGSNKE
ncbi:Mevalonate kinase [Blastomyces dermatitidis]|uniref:Mevalonate kinase n=3 Tax=Blastomyces TaxID=229219 RepID=A0A179UBS2_BLAGS|nr:mevalonate kinase [Blastomyces gilchristii SLH14081]XP_045275683.1 mevalonate kinase [Blastomyces dermatitidis ER-3]EEQ88585.2 mevalonate kinase [Blastomyces dermatitidis ER-3]EGE77245.1 mevalonate kinase [Blastomyces dermatitidis ATCC 18188]OAT05465.1 mevalonate kinase [Blastomyces gilchristii SLH14081]